MTVKRGTRKGSAASRAVSSREFRETQAIERAMVDKTLDEGAWLKAQAEAAAVGEPEPAEATA
jgi:hypothetical protein